MKLLAIVLSSCILVACGGGGTETSTSARTPVFAATVTQSPVLTDYNDVIQQIYVGYFGRPADAGGLAYWEAQFLAAGAPTTVTGIAQAYKSNATVKAMIDSFSTSAESAALYPGDNKTFILAIYKNLFNRVADNAGLAYWAALVNVALTRSDAAISIMAGTQGTDTNIITNKTRVASNFTKALDTPLKAAAYSGLAANVGVRSMLGTVSNTTDVAAFQSTVSATISGLTAMSTTATGLLNDASVSANYCNQAMSSTKCPGLSIGVGSQRVPSPITGRINLDFFPSSKLLVAPTGTVQFFDVSGLVFSGSPFCSTPVDDVGYLEMYKAHGYRALCINLPIKSSTAITTICAKYSGDANYAPQVICNKDISIP